MGACKCAVFALGFHIQITVKLRFVAVFSNLAANGYVYETFGISKHFPIKLQLLLIRAETLDKPLTAKCFIYDVVHWCSVFPVIFLSICYIVSVCRAFG